MSKKILISTVYFSWESPSYDNSICILFQTKLEGYRALDAMGKELSSEQRAAVNKYDAVLATLEFARDLVKQMQQFAKDAEKEQKKQARKVCLNNNLNC